LATIAYYTYSQLLFITEGSVQQAQLDEEQCLRDKGPTHASAAREVNARIAKECGHINRIECSTAESRLTVMQQRNAPFIRGLGKYELYFVNRTKTLIYSLKLKLLLFNIISSVCDTPAPAVQKLADAAQEEVFWVPV
jgi:hypothetical protein